MRNEGREEEGKKGEETEERRRQAGWEQALACSVMSRFGNCLHGPDLTHLMVQKLLSS